MNAEEILESFNGEFGNKIRKTEIRTKAHGRKKIKSSAIWMEIDRSVFRDVIRHLCKIHPYPHFAVASGSDIGSELELVYHFTVNYGQKHKEVLINISVKLPKSDPMIESICDLIPGALISEREKQEMLGITIKNIPDSERVFLPEDFPEGMYPWRKDETSVDKIARNLHESKVVNKPEW